MKALFILREERNAAALYAFLKANWKACAAQGKPLAIQIGPEKAKRNLEQNRRYHAMVRQIEEQVWVEGRQFSSDAWHETIKRKFIGLIDLPGGGTIGQSTTTLSVGEFAEFMTRVEVWAAQELGVCFVEPGQD